MLILLLLAVSTYTWSTPPDTINSFPEHRVQGGSFAFYESIQKNIKYPRNARQNDIIGTAIVALTLAPSGQFTLEMVNSLSRDIDKELTEAFENTQKLWLADSLQQQDVILFFPVTFLKDGASFQRAEHLAGFLLEEIKVVAYQTGGGRARVRNDHSLYEKAVTFYHDKKYEKAMKFLDELIRRDPFNPDYYKIRAYCHFELDDEIAGCQDYQKLPVLLHQPMPAAAKNICRSVLNPH
ncbi:MAG: hypothetical protein ACFB15_10635 [Cyclobacteriaceae bacterium]